jgi:hypothetical protein
VDGQRLQHGVRLNVPVGMLAVIGARLRLAENRGPRTRLDIPGLALVSAGAAALIWAVQGSQAGWSSAVVLAGLPLGAAALGAFLIWETRAPQPSPYAGPSGRTALEGTGGAGTSAAAPPRCQPAGSSVKDS